MGKSLSKPLNFRICRTDGLGRQRIKRLLRVLASLARLSKAHSPAELRYSTALKLRISFTDSFTRMRRPASSNSGARSASTRPDTARISDPEPFVCEIWTPCILELRTTCNDPSSRLLLGGIQT